MTIADIGMPVVRQGVRAARGWPLDPCEKPPEALHGWSTGDHEESSLQTSAAPVFPQWVHLLFNFLVVFMVFCNFWDGLLVVTGFVFSRPPQRPRVYIRTANFVTVRTYVRTYVRKNSVSRGYVES